MASSNPNDVWMPNASYLPYTRSIVNLSHFSRTLFSEIVHLYIAEAHLPSDAL